MLPIAEKIKELRKLKNITQTDLADALGVSFQSVSRWERGQAYPDIEMIPKIAAYFSVTTDVLLIEPDAEAIMNCRTAIITTFCSL
ncbi:MAG: helix-turn-helix transcriptional regulator [Clostridia bacterium]|nr:helix-turn-helix transcriptional regulator [Clostridia bacterium]